MDNFSDDTNDQNKPPVVEPAATEKRPIDAMISALRAGAKDARKAAEDAIPKIKTAASSAAYWTVYGASFAAVFQWTLAKNLTPDSVKSGCRAGAKAGRDAATEWIEQLKRRTSSPEPVALLSPPAQDI